jgi:hypothetical protein
MGPEAFMVSGPGKKIHMASKKKKRITQEENKATTDYYKLNTKAVDDLAFADEENSPEVSKEELRKYRSGSKLRLPDWLKAILIKMWFAGSVCFFIFWGLSSYVGAQLDLIVVFAVALGIVTDILTNNVLRNFSNDNIDPGRFMMFPRKSYWTFIFNILYAGVVLACTAALYGGINLILAAAVGEEGGMVLGVGPILFGVFYTAIDMLFITIRRTFTLIFKDAKENARKPQG